MVKQNFKHFEELTLLTLKAQAWFEKCDAVIPIAVDVLFKWRCCS